MTSTDIGVAENGTEAIGLSLQLKGTGTKYSDFTWQTMTASTYGVSTVGFFDCKIPLGCASVVASNITATTTSLSWDAVTGAVSYRNIQCYYFSAATTSSSFTINNLIANTDYNFTGF
jgi:microcystin-dependent protein